MQLIAKFETLQFWLSVKWGLSNNRISEIFWQIVFVDSFQQTFVGLQDVFKTCSEMSSTRLQRKTKNWKAKNCYAEDVFKTSWRHILKTSWRHVLKTSWRHVLKTSWRHILKTSSRHVLKTPSRRLGNK